MATFDRRDFIKSVLAAGAGIALTSTRGWASSGITPEVTIITANGWVPNNAKLPVLHYRNVVMQGDIASQMEAIFAANQWFPQWRNGVYDYHHYHSTAHEVLGFASGTARLMLGGPEGHEVTVNAGDVVLLPAGTGHCRLAASDDFLVVGAYPAGQSFDICREAPTAEMKTRMASLPFPKNDPVNGLVPDITAYWKA
ncbi:cupin [Cedecea neteri]|nr:cupin [Cedecea neteri]